jgi:hypothetical protein
LIQQKQKCQNVKITTAPTTPKPIIVPIDAKEPTFIPEAPLLDPPPVLVVGFKTSAVLRPPVWVRTVVNPEVTVEVAPPGPVTIAPEVITIV